MGTTHSRSIFRDRGLDWAGHMLSVQKPLKNAIYGYLFYLQRKQRFVMSRYLERIDLNLYNTQLLFGSSFLV